MSLLTKCSCGLTPLNRSLITNTSRAIKTKSVLTEMKLTSRSFTSTSFKRSKPTASTSNLATTASTSSSIPPLPTRPIRNLREEYARRNAAHHAERNRSLLLYSTATIILVTAASYLAVPLYRVFCSATGYAGTPLTDKSRFSSDKLMAAQELDTRRIKVKFNADKSDGLPWSFEPLQREVKVLPGETALAFYTATNKSDEDIIGIATYNVTPNNIAPYFAKVECFCFEEQRILAGEEVDLPVFFFIDKDFMDDPLMKNVDEVTLSYTFFKARRDSYGNLVPSEGVDSVAH